MAMEDFRVDVIVGKGPGATAIPLELPPFTLVGATTRAGLLPPPLRDRFGFTGHMEFYDPAELERVIHRSARPPRRRDRRRTAPPRSPAAPAARPVSPTGCCAASATTPQVKADGVITRDIAARRPGGLRGRRPRPRPARPRRARAPCSSSSAAARSACPRSRSRWGRSARPSRRSPSPSSYGRGCWPGRPRGRVATPAAWAHLGLAPPQRSRRKADNRACSGRDALGQADAPGRNPGAMLGVVPLMRTRLDSADAALYRSAHPPP